MNARDCTCGGIAEGYGMHEAFCGLPERGDDCTCGHIYIDDACPEHGHLLLEPAAVDDRLTA